MEHFFDLPVNIFVFCHLTATSHHLMSLIAAFLASQPCGNLASLLSESYTGSSEWCSRIERDGRRCTEWVAGASRTDRDQERYVILSWSARKTRDSATHEDWRVHSPAQTNAKIQGAYAYVSLFQRMSSPIKSALKMLQAQ